ncbi:MAG: SGNH/GDSL hydrolase family protein [Planctomycetota bacterium]|jgi:lysophospholipase L1-like esterase
MHKPIDFQPGQTLLFIGDSITDCQRQEAPYAPLGCGYVHFAANFLLAARPDLRLTIENRGIGGDSTRDLKWRWNRDCIALSPDIVSMMIGINDLWRKYGDSQESLQRHVTPDEYETNYRQMLTHLKDECGSRLILMEPYMFCDDPDNPMLRDLDAYIQIVHQMANKFDAILVPVHANYMALTHKRPADQWADDTVHPSAWAHAWIAKQWLDTVMETD